MRVRALMAGMAVLSVVACSDDVFQPNADPVGSGPSFAIFDSGTQPDLVQGFWFLPPLAKQVTTEGVLDEELEPSMEVCQLDGNPSALDPNRDPNDPAPEDVACVSGLDPVVSFAAGSATITPGSNYQFSWNTDESQMSKDEFYRVNILLGDVVLGYLDVNPQAPSGETPGEDFDDLYAFRLGETIPVKFFVTPQARCSADFLDGYVIQCVAQGVIDQNGGTVTLEPEQEGWSRLTVDVPPDALPPGFGQVILTLERIAADQFLATEGEECIPGFGSFAGFDAPQFGDCLRVTSDPLLIDDNGSVIPLDFAALVEICIPFTQADYPTIKFDPEEQDRRLQIIRYENGVWQGLPNVTSTSCGLPEPPPVDLFGFIPVPQEEGFFRSAALAADRAVRWLGPEPVSAHGDIRLAGSTTEFSRFRWGLPGQMVPSPTTTVFLQTQEDGSVDNTVPVNVTVQDNAGIPIEDATVHYSEGGSALADVSTPSDGEAPYSWTTSGTTPGATYTLDATALGLLATPVPGHEGLVPFTPATVQFNATVVGVASQSAQSPDADPPLEGAPGETLPTPLSFTVLDAAGNPVVGWDVTWSTTCAATDPADCDGSVSGSTTTDENGQASGFWTLATTPGANTATATVGGTTYTFTAGSWNAVGGCLVEVDGVMSEGEWDCASGTTTGFVANISGGDSSGEVMWQTDGDNLYMLVRIMQTSLDKVNSLRIDFDNSGDGPSAEDDAIGFDYDGAGTGQDAGDFIDEYLTGRCVNRSQSGCGATDVISVDGAGALDNDGMWTVYELSHPLRGDASEDINVDVSADIGFYLTLRIGNGAQGNTQFPDFRQYLPLNLGN